MTDRELKNFFAEIRAMQQETARQMRESRQETDRLMQESRRETERERRETERLLQESRRETERLLQESRQETERERRETERERRETERELRETAKHISRTEKMIGQIGNKFGKFTEGLAWPSLRKMLHRDFGMTTVTQRYQNRQNGRSLELDILAYDNISRFEAYVVEVKSRLEPDGINQILKSIRLLPEFDPAFRDYKIYGLIAAVDIPDDLYNAAIKRGLYVARISDDTLQLAVPPDFKPQAFGPAAERHGRANGRAKKGKAPRK
jgi:hypothetical protein